MPLTDKLSVLSDYLFDMLDTAKVDLGLQAVYYGDQERIPVTPVACVEPDDKDRELKGAPRNTRVMLTVYILVYHSAIRDVQSNRRDVDVLAEAIEDLIHTDRLCGGLVIDCMVEAVESGYANKANNVLRASRIKVVAQSQQMLPYETA